MNDKYEHHDRHLIYVVENIPGPAEESEDYLELINNYNSQLVYNCECKGKCQDEQCLCVHNSGQNNYTFSSYNVLKTYKLNSVNRRDKTNAVFECNDLCSCINFCGNRLVQNGPCEGLSVRNCEIIEKGIGLFTKFLITKDSFVCEYAGELITKSQAIRRHQSNVAQKKMNFIFCLNEHSNGKVTQTFVDPSSIGNVGRYINHSCNPNCHILPVRINSPIPKLAIFSICDILPNQEVTIDYGSNNHSNKHVAMSAKDSKRIKCLCNSSNCRENLPYESY